MKTKVRRAFKQKGGALSMNSLKGAHTKFTSKFSKNPSGASASAPVSSPPAPDISSNPGSMGGKGDVAKCSDPSAQAVEGKNMDRMIKIGTKIGTLFKNIIVGIVSMLRILGTGLYQFFKSAPGEYITFIIFVILIFCGLGWLFFSSNSPLRKSGGWAEWMGRGGGGAGGGGSGITNWVGNLNIDTSWLYKLNISNGSDGVPKTTRKAEPIGRCDDVNRIELNDKQCLNLDIPQTIAWNINPKDIPEWDSLPTIVQRKISDNGNHFTVYIPWDLVDNRFTPNCSKAYFRDGTSAGHLFTDMNGVCKKKVLNANKYNPQNFDFQEDEDGNYYVPNPMDSNKQCQV